MKKRTKQIIFIGMIVYGIYDFGVFAFGGPEAEDTISQVMTDYMRLSRIGCVVIGMILGHFLWPMSVKGKTNG